MSLQAQADGVADRTRSYVAQAIEPVTGGGGVAWWPVATGLIDTFKQVRFEDRQTGWILGRRSFVTTSDGGESWAGRRFDDVTQLNDFEIVGARAVWAVGNDGVILHRSETGVWGRKSPQTTADLYGMDFLNDALTGWIVGERGLLLSTTNGGDTWEPQDSGTDRNLVLVHAFDADTAWVGGVGTFLVTTDGGMTWAATVNNKVLTDVLFLDETVGFAVDGSSLYSSIDGGLTWQQRELRGSNIAVRGLSFLDINRGWLGNLYGQVFRTQDGGTSWSTLRTGARQLNDVYFIDESTGWAVGDDGTLVGTAPLSLPVEGKTPDELLSMLQKSIARPYFDSEGVLERLEGFVDDYSAFMSALRRLRETQAPPPAPN